MLAASLPYDVGRARDLASAAAQIVPVLLLAGVAVPAWLSRDASVRDRRRAWLELLVSAALVGVALLTEFVALYGVYYRLSRHEVHALGWLLLGTGLLTAARVLMPSTRNLALAAKIPEWRLWAAFGLVAMAIFWLALFTFG